MRIALHEGDAVRAGDTVAVLLPVLAAVLDERSMREAQARHRAAAAGVAAAAARIERARVAVEQARLGGGGINVARVVHRLGGDVRAVFPTGGLNGQVLCRLLQAEGVQAECVPLGGETRESFSVFEETSGKDWRFVLPGPALAAALEAGVYLVKPSQRELNELTGAPLAEPAQRLAACRELIARGQAQVVALSLGDQGAMLVSRDGAWQAAAVRVQVASTIGAGDSFVGGMVHALQRGDALEAAFRQAMAASAAALLSPGTALCRPEDVARLLPEVRIRRIG